MSRVGRLILAGVAAFAMLIAGTGMAQAAPRTAVPGTATVAGTLADGTGAVNGTFDVTKFAASGGNLLATGNFTGAVTNSAGTVLASGTQAVTLPVNLAATAGSCQVLHLTLGPLDLNLLGLQVHLDQVVLDITAQSGPGNLLGNLLCAVANLLNGPTGINAIVTQIATLLNRILAGLG